MVLARNYTWTCLRSSQEGAYTFWAHLWLHRSPGEKWHVSVRIEKAQVESRFKEANEKSERCFFFVEEGLSLAFSG